MGLIDSGTGDLYVGDAAGVYLPETGDLRPATPPPDFDLGTALDSIALFKALGPQRLLFSHYGPVADVEEILGRSAEELRVWVDLTRQARTEGMDLDHAAAMVRERTRDRYAALTANEVTAEQFELLSGAPSNVAGILHWLDRIQP